MIGAFVPRRSGPVPLLPPRGADFRYTNFSGGRNLHFTYRNFSGGRGLHFIYTNCGGDVDENDYFAELKRILWTAGGDIDKNGCFQRWKIYR